jgi:protein SCO1
VPSRNTVIFAAACVGIALALLVTALIAMGGRERVGSGDVIASTGEAAIGGPFSLIDQTGAAVDQSILEGRWTLVFFGFTYCPDFCPGTLQLLDATRRELGAAGDDIQILFITVDPARDTPQALADYLSSPDFPPNVIGLTGSDEQIAAAAQAYRAVYSRAETPGGYTMNHTLTVYLMNPEGRFQSALAHGLSPRDAAGVIRRAMASHETASR